MSYFQVRTDLALEASESIHGAGGSPSGVRVKEYEHSESNVKITEVTIETKNAAKAMGKPMGTYVTLEAPGLDEPDDGYHREISEELAGQLKKIIPESEREQSVLVVGLGNQDVTADALGPNVADNLFVNRHVVLEYGKAAYAKDKMHLISCIVPGVMARTGMESAEIVKGVVSETKPDVVLVVDALAARSTKRLNRTIQVTNTGIHPGSGVGNHRNALTEETIGVPVIAIGIPTVVDAATIVGDAARKLMEETGGEFLFHGENTETLAELRNMYVTSKDIDETVKRLGFTISEAINIALDMEG